MVGDSIQKILSVTIDGNTSEELEDLVQMKDIFAENTNLIGVDLFVNGEMTPLHSEHLLPILQELEISHFSIKVNSGEIQDLSKLITLIPLKKWSSICIDAKLSLESLVLLLKMLTYSDARSFSLCSTTFDETNFAALLQLLNSKSFCNIKDLTLNHAGITCSQAATLLAHTRETPLKSLDLSWNNICHTASNSDFETFCKAIDECHIDQLKLSNVTFNNVEALILSTSLANISRRFQFLLSMSPALTEKGIDSLLKALYANQRLTIEFEDPLNYSFDFSNKITEMKNLSNKNKMPTLVELTAKVVANAAKKLPIERLPIDLLEKLPPLCYQQRLKIEKVKNAETDLCTSLGALKIADEGSQKSATYSDGKQLLVTIWKS